MKDAKIDEINVKLTAMWRLTTLLCPLRTTTHNPTHKRPEAVPHTAATRRVAMLAALGAIVLLGCSGQPSPETPQASQTTHAEESPEELSLSDAHVDGGTLVLVYDAPLDEGSVPGTGSYLVEASLLSVDVEAVTIDGSSVVLTLGSGVQAGQSVTVSYVAQPARPLRSARGTPAPPLRFEPAENTTAVTVPELAEARANGAFIELVYDEQLNSGAAAGAAALEAFDVRVGGGDRDVVDVWAEDNVATLLLAWPVSAGETVTVSYTPPAEPESRLQDLGGTDAAEFADRAVRNDTPVPMPELWGVLARSDKLVLIYSHDLGTASVPAASDFSVTTPDGAVEVQSVAVETDRVVLTLARPAAHVAAPVVSYTPVPGRELIGAAGAAADAFTKRAAGPDMPEARLARLGVDDAQQRRIYPRFHPDVGHYALRCSDNDTLRLSLSAQSPTARVSVNAKAGSVAQNEVSGLDIHSDIVVTVTDRGSAADYVLHCIPRDFPEVTVLNATAASQVDLLTMALRPLRTIPAEHNYIAVLNTDGVPVAHRRIDNPHVRQFKHHPDGKYPFSYFSTRGDIDPGYEIEANNFVVLDENLDEVDRISAVPGVSNHVDAHDALIRPNGNYVLISYHLGQRDLSDITTTDGVTLSAEHWVRDTIVTEFNPKHNVVMTWSSRDHVNIRDCLPSLNDEVPFEVFQYGHGNSLQALPDGDIVVSLRKCSQVFRIDYPSGDTVWKVGRSHSTSPLWRSNLITVRDDPYGEFCGQHAAQILENGNLLLFDNGGFCHEDAATGQPDRPNGRVTRIAEYALDPSANEARFLRHHSDQARFDTWNRFRGWVHQLDGGNWLISWGGRRDAPDAGTVPGQLASITEADPGTGEEPLRIRVSWNGGVLSGWVHPVSSTDLGPGATGSN